MRSDAGAVPEWPTAIEVPTREEAIAAAIDLMEPGDVFWIHQETCATRFDDPCDCVVTMAPYPSVIQ